MFWMFFFWAKVKELSYGLVVTNTRVDELYFTAIPCDGGHECCRLVIQYDERPDGGYLDIFKPKFMLSYL